MYVITHTRTKQFSYFWLPPSWLQKWRWYIKSITWKSLENRFDQQSYERIFQYSNYMYWLADNADKLGKSLMEVKWLQFWLANYSTSPNIGDYSNDSTKNKHSLHFQNICFVWNFMKRQLPVVESFCLNIWNEVHQIPLQSEPNIVSSTRYQ